MDFVLFQVVFLSLPLFLLLFPRFFEIRLRFIVRSQIGGEYELEIEIFGFATPWRRAKLCLISKKVVEKGENGMSDLKIIGQMGCKVVRFQNERCPISKTE